MFINILITFQSSNRPELQFYKKRFLRKGFNGYAKLVSKIQQMWLEYFVENWVTKSRHSVTLCSKNNNVLYHRQVQGSFTLCKTQKLLETRKHKENRLKWYRQRIVEQFVKLSYKIHKRLSLLQPAQRSARFFKIPSIYNYTTHTMNI